MNNFDKFSIKVILLFLLAIYLFFYWLFYFYTGHNLTVNADYKPIITKSKIYKIYLKWKAQPKKEFVKILTSECKKQKARNIKHCIKVWISINYAESSFKSFDLGLQSKDKSIKRGVKQYNKYWYKAKDWFFFYGDKNKVWKSNYCTSEESSWSKKWCPNGRKNFDRIYFNINFN